ncbi:MAG: cytochrome c [Gammaproteobacteria bacterium]|nr:cytochrome c [Gammaproteobacteria bacterium]
MDCGRNTRNAIVALAVAGFCLPVSVKAEQDYDPNELQRGAKLFQNYCAACHGADGEGTVTNWQQRDSEGRLPPPPLNGTAHTWHHSVPVLFKTIKYGTLRLGGNMPAWKNQLSDEEILLVINWITSLWPEEIYKVWREQNAGP